MLNNNSEQISTLKSFWKRPEGKTGGIFMAGIVIGGSILLYKLLPYIITLLKNGITASILAVVLGAIVYVILDPKFRNLVWFLYKSIMRTVTSLFIQIDPVGIMKTYIDSLRKNLSMMNEQITTLKGQIRNLQEIITNNNEEKENNIQLAKQAQKTGNKNQVILKTRKAGRLDNSNFKLEDLSKKMEILYRVLNKMHENAGLLLEDIVDEVKVREKERAAIKVSHSAMKSAMNIISGDPDKKLMFEQAMEVVVDDIGRKLREMERFMEVSTVFMDGIDLQNGVYEEKGLQLLEKWEKEEPTFLLPINEKRELIEKANNPNDVLVMDSEQNNSKNKYANIL